MKKIFNEKTLTILIIIVMVSLPFAEIIGLFFSDALSQLLQKELRPNFFFQEEIVSFTGYFLSVFLLLYCIYENIAKKDDKNKHIVLSDFFIITSIIFCIISIIFSKDLTRSLTGEIAYSETPSQVLGYFSVFFACTLINNEKNKKTILKTFLILAIFESIIAFLQNFSLWPISSLFDSKAHLKNHLAFGLTEHCNYFAAIATIFTALFAASFIYSEKKYSYFYLFGATFSCLATLFTYTRLGWVGIFSIIFGIAFLEYFLYRKQQDLTVSKLHFKRFIIITILFIICFLIVGILSGQLLSDLLASRNELFRSKFEEFGTRRGTIWKVGLSSLKKYPLTGVGFDNYRYSFKIYPEQLGWSQNKGHNEYIHILVTQGIPSGINYLIFVFYCCYFPFKKILENKTEFGKSKLTKLFLIALFAFLVQALFNSSVTNVAPYKWILMGLLLPRVEQKNNK